MRCGDGHETQGDARAATAVRGPLHSRRDPTAMHSPPLPAPSLALAAAAAALLLLAGMAAPIRVANEYEAASLRAINAHRAGQGLPGLSGDPKLHRLAREHSEAMARRGTLDHDGFRSRFERAGYSACVENLARNQPTPTGLVAAWSRSSGHNANMLNVRVTHAAVAQSGTYVTFLACG